MQVVSSILALRETRAALSGSVGLVPTMGALHEGHMSLARQAVSENDATIATIFVNPTQFGPSEDLGAYPRDLPRDLEMLEKVGVDMVFTPAPDQIYPAGYQTYVVVEDVTQGLEGGSRPGHFRGVATVVCKLFNVCQPNTAYFGQKDAQQIAVIRRMVEDLNIQVSIAVCPTVREPDGLAMSTRNIYLTPEQRRAARVLSHALRTAGEAYDRGEILPNMLQQIMVNTLRQEPLAEVDYVSVSEAHTLKEADAAADVPLLLSLAVRIGRARLIDNVLVPLTLNSREGLAAVLGNPTFSGDYSKNLHV